MKNTMPFTIAGRELTLRWEHGVFQPTTVTQRIAERVKIPAGAAVLDLGCGVGPLAVHAALEGASRVVASDVMEQAAAIARENVEAYNVGDTVDVRCGDLFATVQGEKFDIIINDVSGIAEKVARISGWYPTTIPTGGEDGTNVVNRMLEDATDYLNPNGTLYFATSSLSDDVKIAEHARSLYGDLVEELKTYRIPFNGVLIDAIEDLRKLRDEGTIDFEERRSRMLWWLKIYRIHFEGVPAKPSSPRDSREHVGK